MIIEKHRLPHNILESHTLNFAHFLQIRECFMSGTHFSRQAQVFTNAHAHSFFFPFLSQSDLLTSCPKAFWLAKKGPRAPLFSLWFSYYTEINTVKLFCATQRHWTHGELALNAFISFFFFPFLFSLFICPVSLCFALTHTYLHMMLHTLTQASPDKQLQLQLNTVYG